MEGIQELVGITDDQNLGLAALADGHPDVIVQREIILPVGEVGVQEDVTEFRLEADTGTRGQRVGHTGSEIEPTIPTENRPQSESPVDDT